MDRQTAQTLIENTFNYPFNEERFRYFTINLLNDVDEGKAFPYLHGQYIKDSFKQHIKKYKRIGTYTDPDSNKVDVLVVHLTKPWALERSRTMLRNFAAWYLKNRDEKDAALIGYYTDDPDDWRFSFIKMEYRQAVTETGKIKVKEELTSARRYSYLVGKNEPNHTAQAQLIPILEDDQKNPSLSDIEDAFSVDAVAKQFYKDYRTLFEKLTDELNVILKKDAKIKREFEDKTIDTANFSKKLMGQIVFLYFLQKKGWLGVGRDEKGNYRLWGTGPKNFLRRLFNKEYIDYKNFFNDVLEPLFYEALATERPNDSYSRFNCKIPFLNGGLFEPINDYNWDETDILIDNAIFSEILGIFDRYNFTVKEDDPLDKEVAVDPEMLGKVFENLLPENLRKGKGAYYTPRTIVHYMCQESLINYLATECEGTVPKADIETFIRKGESAIEFELAIEEGTKSYKHQIPNSIRKNSKLIDEKLMEIKVCDPAIGSGAFPVGMMNEIVKARMILDIYLKTNKTVYDIKRHCIRHSLYGVDIDSGAIDIAKLRLWLSLVVDEEDYHTIKPLPNLDFKIMQGNSLIEEFYGISLDIEKKKGQIELDLGVNTAKLDRLIEKLHEMQIAFFNAVHPNEKQKRKQDVEQVILKIFRLRLEQNKKYDPKKGKAIENELSEMTHGNKVRIFFPWKLYFADVFRERGGFDIVIANPPYMKERDNALIFKPVNESNFGKKYHQGKMDYWFYFLHKAMDIVRERGFVEYITHRYWINSDGAKKLIKRINDELTILNVLDIGKVKVFANVIGQHMVALYTKNTTPTTVTYKKIVDNINDLFSMENTPFITIMNLKSEELISKDFQIRFEKGKVDYSKVKTSQLGDLFDCSQGVVEAPDKVSRKAYNDNPIEKVDPGDGVFVLKGKEVKRLKLNKKELLILKPYLDPKSVGKYSVIFNDEYLIYSDKKTKKKIGSRVYPVIKAHLDKYNTYITSSNKPYGIHRPRKQKYFDSPKLICKAMFVTPEFVYDEEKHYVGFSFTVIININPKYSLKYLLGIMNSTIGAYWFKYNGKKRGVGYDIGVKVFRKFPVAEASPDKQKSIIDIVDEILSIKKSNPQANTIKLESKIDHIVYELYDLTQEEIGVVEESVG